MDSWHVTYHVTNHVTISCDINSVYSEFKTESALKMNGIMLNKTVEWTKIEEIFSDHRTSAQVNLIETKGRHFR